MFFRLGIRPANHLFYGTSPDDCFSFVKDCNHFVGFTGFTNLIIIRLVFLKIVFSVRGRGERGGGQFDLLSYFKKN